MATIVSLPTLQQQQQQQQQQLQQSQQTAQTQDPLFEALVKYITSSPGASSTTSGQIEDIINSHASVDGGRAYLEGLVAPDMIMDPRVWNHHCDAHGFMSTNMNSLTLVFTAAPGAYVTFRGNAPGFFGPWVSEFDSAIFYWDEDFSQETPVRMELNLLPQSGQVVVKFFAEVSISGRSIAELVVNRVSGRLPPQGARGAGRFTPLVHTQ